jgi:hypothetical protein
MISSLRRAVGVVTAAGVIGGLALVAPAAQAAPAPETTPRVAAPFLPDGGGRPPQYKIQFQQLSKAKQKQVKVANYILNKALSKKGTLDYKKANAYDKRETAIRRQVAAGVLWSGRKVTNISRAERAKVKKYLPKKRASAFSLTNSRGLPDGPKCTGNSGWRNIYDQYGTKRGYMVLLNSCETSNVVIAAGMCAFVGAIVTLASGSPYAAGVGATAAICGLGGLLIDEVRDWSNTKSVAISVVSNPIGMLTLGVTPQ